MNNAHLVVRVRRALASVLPAGVKLAVSPAERRPGCFEAVVAAGPLQHRTLVGWAGEGWPADVDRVLGGGADIAANAGASDVDCGLDVIVARDLSVGARERLAACGIGWVDEVGRANLALASGLVVMREVADRPRPAAPQRWTASSVTVAEAVLTGVVPTVDAVQAACRLSRGSVANALSLLETTGLLCRDAVRGPGAARRVTDRARLLEQYSDAVEGASKRSRPVLLHRLWRDPLEMLIEEFASALDGSGGLWAVSGAAAAGLLAPYLSSVSVIELYVDADVLADRARLGARLGAREVDRGQRIEVRALGNRITATAGPMVRGVRCAAVPRVYADLRARGGRFEEAAQHLWEVLGDWSCSQQSVPGSSGGGTRPDRR